ncbi:MAG: hypothetical protein U9R19_12810 [Bacteroidota bacterium]|nr:hypothetical protein [Bacteroidota bacterium]
MKFQEIKILLEKYYNAESNLNEEKQLRKFFSSENVPVEMQASKEQFIFFSDQAKERPEATNLEDKIMENIMENENVFSVRKKKPAPIIGRIVTAVAAGIMLIFIVKSFDESFSKGMQADKLTASLSSLDCGDLQTCYQNTSDALLLMSAGINNNDKLIGQVSNENSFAHSDSKSNKNAIVVDKNKLRQVIAKDNLKMSPNFIELAKNILSLKISLIDKSKSFNNDKELKEYFNSIIASDIAYEISSSEINKYSVWIIDKGKDQHLIFFQSTTDKDILIEISGDVKLSEISNFVKP